jgi:BirA family biotin operon repressor/biotin-[acetyl-CoA-carboxylase] ligase
MNLDARPPLNATSLRSGLGPPWRHLEVVAETGSTNADLIARAAAGEDVEGVVLIAEHQTAGRGRMGRTWSAAPRAQITLSVGVGARDVPTAGWGWLPLAAGLAVVDAVAAVTGVEAGLKWPNDVLVEDRKLAGILAEVAPSETVIVVGVGLNVTLSPEEAGDPGATSLLDLGVAAPDRDALVARLLHEFGRRVDVWRRVGGTGGGLSDDYRARSLTIGNPVRATLPGGREIVGTARSIDEQGRVCLETDGQTTAVSAGDVVNLRPSP